MSKFKRELAEIKAMQSASESSPYNEAKASSEMQNYYNNAFKDYTRSKRAAEEGMTADETAAAKQNFAEAQNFGATNALNAGQGGMAQYINANLNANQNKFIVDLASRNQEIKRQNQQMSLSYLSNLGQASGAFQDIQTQNFNKTILEQQALGLAETSIYARKDARNATWINAGASVLGAGTTAAIGAMKK